MLNYMLRRILYAVPILIGVNLITFALFFALFTPDDMAARVLGKRATPESIEQWKQNNGYNVPRIFNSKEKGLSKLESR